MESLQRVVLLACGSFNPPTNMHLRMFELGRDHLERLGRYKVIEGIMSPVSDHYKKKDLATAKDRCEMVEKALETSNWVRVDTWESSQEKWLETVYVLKHHKLVLDGKAEKCENITPSNAKKRKKDIKNEDVRKHEEGQTPQLMLLCGGDLLESFATPGLWTDEDIEDILKNYGLVCIGRAGSNERKFIYESDVLTKYQHNIHLITEWMQHDISATKIRRALRRSESVKYLLQDSVIEYINKQGLYTAVCDK